MLYRQPFSHESRFANPGQSRLLPGWLPLQPISRWPTRLSPDATRAILNLPPAKRPVSHRGTPHFSIVVLTRNQRVFTQLCISSLLDAGSELPYELLVVDNGSTDGTVEYLDRLSRLNPQLKPIFNRTNRGFAAANNQALDQARGEILVLLNNDTVVPPGWLEGLSRPLLEKRVGMTAPLTNRSGGENEIESSYQTYAGFLELAACVATGAAGPSFDCSMLPMCCIALRRDTWERVGPLDEEYEIGLFEDDDYSLRVKQGGYRLVASSHCFVHHFGQASMGSGENYSRLFQSNRERFENKWNLKWERPAPARSQEYRTLIQRLRDLVSSCVPPRARIAVITRGDEELLQLGNFQQEHFMQDSANAYAGHHPADSREALDRLESLRRRGIEYLVIPETSIWWLDYYRDFGSFLVNFCTLSARVSGAGRIYQLDSASSAPSPSTRGTDRCQD